MTPMSVLRRVSIPLALFVIAFVPRTIYSVTRALNWYERSIRFADALFAGDWAQTYQYYHPGVTTMWLSGLALKIFGRWHNLSSAEMLHPEQLPPGMLHQAISFGVIPLALVVALGIVWAYYLLRRLTEPRLALLAALFLALDPFYLAHSKVLHLDGTMSMFMLLTVLLLLSYRQQPDRRKLIGAGVLTGLSFLTKSASVSLIPFGALLIVSVHPLVLPEGNVAAQLRARAAWLGQVTMSLAVWGAATTVTFFALWPAMWVMPLNALAYIANNGMYHVEEIHPNPLYFNGVSSLEDPGTAYYAATLLWRTTLVTLPFALAGLAAVLVDIWRKERPPYQVVLRWLLIYGFIVLLQMGISAKKDERYILPAFLVLDIIAAYGVLRFVDGLQAWLRPRQPQRLAAAVMAVFVLVQAIMALRLHPYYGNHYNLLLGGPSRAQQVLALQYQGEGIDQAGRFLNSLPGAAEARATIYPNGSNVLIQFWSGTLEVHEEAPDPAAAYRIYFQNQIVRGLGGEGWMAAWAADQQREPLWTVDFDGITYVWIYEAE
jgi:4-amino-4-deoxy-L-arabinose transferase-like glycosyltransferase